MDPSHEPEFHIGFSAVEPLFIPKTCEHLFKKQNAKSGAAVNEHCLIVFPEARFVPGLKKSDVKRIMQQLEDPTKHVRMAVS
jgi:hypothetical protein